MDQPWVGEPLSQHREVETLTLGCALCRKTFQSSHTLEQHLESSKHKRMESEGRKSLSPAKKSPGGMSVAALKAREEAAAVEGSAARSAQAYYDVGMEHAKALRGVDCIRCMNSCLARLPVLGEASSVGRVMIEVKARCVLARVYWLNEPQQALAQVKEILRALHRRGEAFPFDPMAAGVVNGDDDAWDRLRADCESWRDACRPMDGGAAVLEQVSKEFGCRICIARGTLGGAALLVTGHCYREAAMVFCDLQLWNHAMHCALLSGKHPYCMEIAIAHPNPVFLRNECLPRFSPALASLALAFLEWDSHSLDVLRVSPDSTVAVRNLASLALQRLNNHH